MVLNHRHRSREKKKKVLQIEKPVSSLKSVHTNEACCIAIRMRKKIAKSFLPNVFNVNNYLNKIHKGTSKYGLDMIFHI